MHKIITIKPVLDSNSHLPDVLLEDHIYRLGSQIVGSSTLNPLTKKEEQEILYPHLGLDDDLKANRLHILEFWQNFTIKVPAGGKVLLVDVDENGYPINVFDYLAYKFAKKHSKVAINEEELKRSPAQYRFYLIDPESVKKKEIQLTNLQYKATEKLIEIYKDKALSKAIYAVLGGTRANFTDEEVIKTFLYKQANSNPTKFIEKASDKTISDKALIRDLIDLEVLRKIGNTYLYMNETIAEGDEEMIAFLKAKSNAGIVSDWNITLKEKGSIFAK